MSVTFYKILELKDFASVPEVKKAFKRLSLKYHPDRNPNDKSAEEKFKQINEAYKVLSNEESKANYDARLNSLTTAFVDYYTQQTRNYKNYQEEQKRRAEILRKAEKERFENAKFNIQVSLLCFVGFMYLFILVGSTYDFVSRLYYYKAYCLEKKNADEKAWKALNWALSYDNSYAEAHVLIAKIAVKRPYIGSNVRTNLQAALDLGTPNYLRCIEMRLYTHAKDENYKKLLQDYENLIYLTPQPEAKALAILDTLWATMNSYEAVGNMADICSGAMPQKVEPYLIGSVAYSLAGNKKKAEDRLKAYKKFGAVNYKQLNGLMQNTYYSKGQVALSILLANLLLEKPNPFRAQALCVRAHANSQDNNHEAALTDYDTVIKENPSTDSLYYFRAVSYLTLGKADSACLDWNRALARGYKGRNATLEFFCSPAP